MFEIKKQNHNNNNVKYLCCSEPSDTNWDMDVRDDVIEECSRYGGVLHVFVDKKSPDGNVYVKCASIQAAVNSVQSLHGRWFAGECFYYKLVRICMML